MGIDSKYGKVTVENVRSTPIGDDEPVVVFRAQDKLLPQLMAEYHRLCREAGASEEHLDLIVDTINTIKDWQSQNTTQVPGS